MTFCILLYHLYVGAWRLKLKKELPGIQTARLDIEERHKKAEE